MCNKIRSYKNKESFVAVFRLTGGKHCSVNYCWICTLLFQLGMLTLAGWQEDLWPFKLWPVQARGKRMMWLMDSDLVGLRTLADAGLSLNDCSDLFIHQADCDKAASTAQSRRRNFPCPHCCSKTFASPQGAEGHPTEPRAAGFSLQIWMLAKLWADLVYAKRPTGIW